MIRNGLIAAGAFYVVPLLQAFVLQKADLAGWIFCVSLAVASVAFYGLCLRFNKSLPATPARTD